MRQKSGNNFAPECSSGDLLCTYLDVASKIVETAAFELAEEHPSSIVERLLNLAVEIDAARDAIG